MKETVNIDRLVRGTVSGTWFNPKTGDRIPFEPRCNQLTYGAADAMALAYAGNTVRTPKYIGFMYGPNASPSGLHPPSDRQLTWDGLASEAVAATANILISNFSIPPTISVDDGNPSLDVTGKYVGNCVTFHAYTRSGEAGTYAFPTSGSQYADVFSDDMTLYHAILLGDDPNVKDKKVPLARVSLEVNNQYRQKPADYELALDWRVTFF